MILATTPPAGLLSVNGTLIAEAIVFLLMVGVLWRWVYPIVIRMAEQRERAIETGLQQAQEAEKRLADVRADRLQHSELRFLEIARALMPNPAFLLLDEPAAGLAGDEIQLLGALITAISRTGVGVLLIEHHTDLVFDICEQVTVLNLGRTLAKGTPAEIMAHQDVIDAYLGS